MIYLFIATTVVFFLLAAGYRNEAHELEEDLEIEKTMRDEDNARLSSELSIKEVAIKLQNDKNIELIQQVADLTHLTNVQEAKFKKLKKFLEEGVFYDKENDVIVTVDNLDRIGDL